MFDFQDFWKQWRINELQMYNELKLDHDFTSEDSETWTPVISIDSITELNPRQWMTHSQLTSPADPAKLKEALNKVIPLELKPEKEGESFQ